MFYSNHLIPFQVVDRTTIPCDFSLSMIGLFILWIVMGEVYVPTSLTLGLAPWHTLPNGNVSRYDTNHLQAEVLTVLHYLDRVPALCQKNSMSQMVTVLSALLLIKIGNNLLSIKDNKDTWYEKYMI